MKNKIKLFDELFLNNHDTSQYFVPTNLLIQRIIEDRKYNIPDYFYKYITQDILVSIIYGYHEDVIHDDIVTFITNCVDKGVIHNQKAFIIALMENGLLEYGFLANPRILYKTLIKFMDNISLPLVMNIISNWIKFNMGKGIKFPKYYIRLYIRMYRYINKIRVNDAFPIHYSIIDDYLLPNVLQLHGCDGVDCVFETVWDMYCERNVTLYDAYHNKSSLQWYWLMFGGNFIPDSASLNDIDDYVTIKSKTTSRGMNPKVKTLMTNLYKKCTGKYNGTELIGLHNRISSTIVSTIISCPDNMNVIYWSPNIIESNMIMSVFNKYPERVSNYDVIYKLTGKYPNSEPLLKYIQAGNDYFGISKYAEKTPHLDPETYIETICLGVDDDTLKTLLLDKKPFPILKIHMTFFEFVMKKYVDNNGDYRIKDRLKSIILNNSELFYNWRSNTGQVSKVRLLSLLDMQNTCMENIALMYPSTLYSLSNMYAFYYEIKAAMAKNYELIYYVPWNRLTRDDIVNEIRLNGYFPVRQEMGISKMINEFISGEDMYVLISSGYGFGYILDYDIMEYTKSLINAALTYLSK